MERESDDPQDHRGYGEEGRTPEEQDRAAEGKPAFAPEEAETPMDPQDPVDE